MQQELQINTKLFGFDGIIGRRDYFLNNVILSAISLIFIMPCQLWIFSKIGTLSDLGNLFNIFSQMPLLLKIWSFCGTLPVFILFASNLFRRLNDINGKNIIGLNIFVILLFLPAYLYFLLPFFISFVFGLISTILGLVILFKKGKITGQLPYDFTKEFNWGAYLGTWIWGLFNKSYKTLWFLILGFTPWAVLFQLYCGIKGNEWAFKNKKCDDVNKFNKSQEKQTLIFAVLFLVAVPIIYFCIIFAIVSALMFASFDNSNPEKTKQKMEVIEDKLSKFASLYFEAHLITPDENKYYVSSANWKGYSFKEKKDLLDMAASLAANEREKEYKKQNPNQSAYTSFTKSSELNRTKIYDYETKKLLGEFNMDEDSYNNASFKDAVLEAMKAYKFYNAD